jgi:hypothetical protein
MRPFHKSHTNQAFRGLVESITAEIDGLENDYVLKASTA